MAGTASMGMDALNHHRSHFGSRYHTRADAVTQAFLQHYVVQLPACALSLRNWHVIWPAREHTRTFTHAPIIFVHVLACGGNKEKRAHPDLNQGPADLQSAALTTELCTQY